MVPGRRAVPGVIAAGVLVLLSACASAEKEAGMTPHEARDTLVKVITDTSGELDVAGWKAHGAASVRRCEGGDPSVTYGYFYGASPGTDHLGDAQKVAAYWKKLGMSVRMVTDPVPLAYATGGPVEGLSFSTAPGNYIIAGSSVCVPGDLTSLIHEQAGE